MLVACFYPAPAGWVTDHPLASLGCFALYSQLSAEAMGAINLQRPSCLWVPLAAGSNHSGSSMAPLRPEGGGGGGCRRRGSRVRHGAAWPPLRASFPVSAGDAFVQRLLKTQPACLAAFARTSAASLRTRGAGAVPSRAGEPAAEHLPCCFWEAACPFMWLLVLPACGPSREAGAGARGSSWQREPPR